MSGGASRSDAVAGLLGRAVNAGLALRWVGLAVHEGGGGMCWSAAGSGSDGGEEADLRFDLASLTKPLATATLLLLARRDGLDLDQPVSEIVPELAGPRWGEVTFAQCATHTAGFPAWAPLYAAGGCDREAYLDALGRLEPVAAAGTRVEYSCLGFLALGIALERAGGADLGTLFADLVAEPLGLREEVGFAPSPEACVAPGERRWYAEEGLLAARGIAAAPPPAAAGAWPCDDGNARGLGGAAGNAGLFGTAAAVARLAAEYLPGGGELLDAGEAELATRCHTAGLEQARGIGWQLAASPGCSAGPALPASAFGHTGFTGVSAWSEREGRVVFVLLGNRLHPGGRTSDLHPLRRRFHALAREAVRVEAGWGARG